MSTPPSIPHEMQKALQAASIPLHGCTLTGNILTLGTGQRLFARSLSSRKDIAQARGEAEGLHWMSMKSDLASKLIQWQQDHDTEDEAAEWAVILSEYFDLGGRMGDAEQRKLAQELAKMHQPISPDDVKKSRDLRAKQGLPALAAEMDDVKFGFPVPTHCGVTEQDNTFETDWATFYRERRLGDMVKRIGDMEISREWERMLESAIPLLLNSISPTPQPTILHGDLWSGNKGMSNGRPVVFDPAAYFGHNEADLGIMLMFGGFSQAFFDEYHKHHPRSEPYYAERQKLYELYHHLNHTLMFGGGYKGGSLRIMRDLVTWAEGV